MLNIALKKGISSNMVPNQHGFSPGDDVARLCSAVPQGWIRVGGTLAALFGCYYWGAAFGDSNGSGSRAFYMSTVVGRVGLVVAFAAIVAAGEVGPALLIPAVSDASLNVHTTHYCAGSVLHQ